MTIKNRNRGFHHVVYACRNSEETRHFYEDLLGMPLVHTEVKNAPDGFFRHLFFDTGDGSCIAFFEEEEDCCKVAHLASYILVMIIIIL